MRSSNSWLTAGLLSLAGSALVSAQSSPQVKVSGSIRLYSSLTRDFIVVKESADRCVGQWIGHEWPQTSHEMVVCSDELLG